MIILKAKYQTLELLMARMSRMFRGTGVQHWIETTPFVDEETFGIKAGDADNILDKVIKLLSVGGYELKHTVICGIPCMVVNVLGCETNEIVVTRIAPLGREAMLQIKFAYFTQAALNQIFAELE